MKKYNIPEEKFQAIYACNKHVDETIFLGAFETESFANKVANSLENGSIEYYYVVKVINYTQLKKEIGSWHK